MVNIVVSSCPFLSPLSKCIYHHTDQEPNCHIKIRVEPVFNPSSLSPAFPIRHSSKDHQINNNHNYIFMVKDQNDVNKHLSSEFLPVREAEIRRDLQ